MKKYGNLTPQFSYEITIPEPTDPGHADIINPASEQLLQNTLVLKKELENVNQQTGEYTFSEALPYAAGDYCIYDNTLYKFTAAKEPGTWNEDVVQRTSILSELKELFDALGGLKLRKIREQDYQKLPDRDDNTLYFSPKEG